MACWRLAAATRTCPAASWPWPASTFRAFLSTAAASCLASVPRVKTLTSCRSSRRSAQFRPGKSLENAYTFVLALGGSTNAVLHLMAIAREAEVEWNLADFDRLGAKVPHLADLKPGGRFVIHDLYKEGGTPAVLKALLEAGMLHGDCITCTGATLAENLKDVNSVYQQKQSVVKPLKEPMYASGHIVIL